MTPSYVDHLELELAERPPNRKGLRTRARLRIAAAKVLEQKGYHALRITDVTDLAEVAEGSFYLYFSDKTDVTLSVLTGMLDDFFAAQMAETGSSIVPEAIRQANRRWIGLCRANAGLMRCVFQLADSDEAFANLLHQANRQWYGRVAQSFTRRRAEQGGSPALFGAYLLGSMMDEVVRKLIVYPDPKFLAVLADLGADDMAVADATSLIWLKVVFPTQPRLEKLPPAAAALAAWINAPED